MEYQWVGLGPGQGYSLWREGKGRKEEEEVGTEVQREEKGMEGGERNGGRRKGEGGGREESKEKEERRGVIIYRGKML